MAAFLKNHPLFTVLVLLVMSPILSVVLIVGWILMCLINMLMWALAWPFRVLTSFVTAIFSGGIR